MAKTKLTYPVYVKKSKFQKCVSKTKSNWRLGQDMWTAHFLSRHLGKPHAMLPNKNEMGHPYSLMSLNTSSTFDQNDTVNSALKLVF